MLKSSQHIEQRFILSWIYGLNGNTPIESSFLLTLKQYIQWHWLERESIQLLFGILLRQYDRHGKRLFSSNELATFIFHLLFPSFKIVGYVSEQRDQNEPQLIFENSEIIINHLQCLKVHRNVLIESLWIEIENALVRNHKTIKLLI